MPLHQGPFDTIGLALQNHLLSDDWTRVDIAVAWINHSFSNSPPGEEAFDLIQAFETFLDRDGTELHLTFGNSMHGSEREGVDLFRDLALDGEGRAVNLYAFQGDATFHPKAYMFSNEHTQMGCLLVGSANLTFSALVNNYEAMLEIAGGLGDEDFVAAREFFDRMQAWQQQAEQEEDEVVVDRLILGGE